MIHMEHPPRRRPLPTLQQKKAKLQSLKVEAQSIIKAHTSPALVKSIRGRIEEMESEIRAAERALKKH